MIGLIIFAFVFIVITFIVITNALCNLTVGLSYELNAKKHSLKNAEKEIHLNTLRGPKIKYIEPKALILQKSLQIDQGVFDNPNHKNHILNDISISLGQELLEQKLINFDIQSNPSPNYMGKEYRITAQIKVYNDSSN